MVCARLRSLGLLDVWGENVEDHMEAHSAATLLVPKQRTRPSELDGSPKVLHHIFYKANEIQQFFICTATWHGDSDEDTIYLPLSAISEGNPMVHLHDVRLQNSAIQETGLVNPTENPA